MTQKKQHSAIILGSLIHAHYWFTQQLPLEGEHLSAHDYQHEIGGKGLNVSIALKRLGIDNFPIIACGQDLSAQQCKELLMQEGICTDYFQYFPGQPSGSGVAIIDQHGRNVLAIHLASNLLLEAEYIQKNWQQLSQSRLIYAQFETSLDAIAQAFQLAKQHNITTVLNPSPWREIPNNIKTTTEVLILNQSEAEQLFGLKSLERNQDLKSVLTDLIFQNLTAFLDTWQSLELLVITLSEYGCFAFDFDALIKKEITVYWLDAPPISALDTTGCGDAFASMLCEGLIQRRSLAENLTRATQLAGYIAQYQGILLNLLTLDQFEAYVAECTLPHLQSFTLVFKA